MFDGFGEGCDGGDGVWVCLSIMGAGGEGCEGRRVVGVWLKV